jgi:hypothetical protein
MTTSELIYQKVQQLPKSKQAEILEYVEFLGSRQSDEGEMSSHDWTAFSLSNAMRGMEYEEDPGYTLGDTLMSADDLRSLEETVYLLRSPKNARFLLNSLAQARGGKVKERNLNSGG